MSNPHEVVAERLVAADGGWGLGYETADAQHIVGLLEANMQATLALAYEQRTANMLAFMQPLEMTDGAKMTISVERAIEIRNDVGERLGIRP